MRLYKQAQITYFILLGILLLGGALFFLTQKESSVPAISLEQQLLKTPIEFRPVVQSVQSCLQSEGKNVLLRVGSQGGIANTRDIAADGTNQALSINPVSPTDSEGFALSENIIVPYWTYLDGEAACGFSCVQRSRQPPLENALGSVQAQIAAGITAQLPSCVDAQFFMLKNQGFQLTYDDPEVDVTIRQDDVVVRLRFEVRASKDGSEFSTKDFTQIFDLRLRDIYNYAQTIMQFQRQFDFFERGTISIIGAHGGLESGQLPPIADTDIRLGRRVFWIKSQVREQLEDYLTSYIPLFQVHPSFNAREVNLGSEAGNAIRHKFVMPLGINPSDPEQRTTDPSWETMSVNFAYLPLQPLYLEMRGANVEGEVLSGASTLGTTFPLVSMLQAVDYEFYYDVSYPVLASITDQQAFGGEGYTFQFAIETNMQNNNDPIPALETPDGELLRLQVIPPTSASMVCNANQKNGKEYDLRAIDAITRRPVEDAQIVFSCGQSCSLGFTEIDGVHSRLRSQLPSCIGGKLKAIRPGYVSQPLPFSTALNHAPEVTLEMYPNKVLTFDVKKFANMQSGITIHDPITKHIFNFATVPAALLLDEEAIVMIKPSAGNALTGQMPLVLSYKTKDIQSGIVPSFAVVPGTYEVTIMVLQNRKMTTQARWNCLDFSREEECNRDGTAVPPLQDREVDEFGVAILSPAAAVVVAATDENPCGEIQECSFMDEQVFDPSIFKGQSTFTWTVPEGVYAMNHVTFFAVTGIDGFGVDAQGKTNLMVTDLELMGKAQELADGLGTRLNPLLSRR